MMQIYKQWLKYSISLIISIVILVSIFNYRIDSLSIYGNSDYISDAAKSLVDGNIIAGLKNYDERIFQKLVIKNLKTKNNVIVIGSSRSMKLRKKYLSYKATAFFNHSVSGASLEDYIAIIGIYEKTYGYIPSTVVLGIDPWIFNKNNGLLRWKSLEDFYHYEMNRIYKRKEKNSFLALNITKWKQLFNYDYTISNILFFKSVILENKKIFYTTTTIDINDSIKEPDGSTEEPYNERFPNDTKVKLSAIAYTQGNVFALNNYYEMSNIKLFENFVTYLKSKKVTVILFLPPYHPITYDILSNNEKYKHILITEQYLKEFAAQNKLELYGSFNPHKNGFTNKNFLDGMHGRDSVAKKCFESKAMYNILTSEGNSKIEH